MINRSAEVFRHSTHILKSLAIACCLAFIDARPSSAIVPVVDWTRQIGTASPDESRGASADGLGHIYFVGNTAGSLSGVNAGETDIFISKFSDSGTPVWTRQLGDARIELGLGISANEPGAVYFSGTTSEILQPSNDVVIDAIVGKYDSAGNLLWTNTLSTQFADRGNSVAADGLGGVYFGGATGGTKLGSVFDNQNAFLRKYDSGGALSWSTSVATSAYDAGTSVAADGLGHVYLAGATRGNLMGTNAGDLDAFLCKFDDNGQSVWTRQFGTSATDYIESISADTLGNVYVAGTTSGSLQGSNLGASDAFVRMYDSAGQLKWTRQLGTNRSDQGFAVEADGFGNVFVSAAFGLGPSTVPNESNDDVFFFKFDSGGQLIWQLQIGSAFFDQAFGLTADALGNAFLSGRTSGNLGGLNAGGHDAFLLKVREIPEPSTVGIALFALIGAIVLPKRRYFVRD